MSVPGIIGSAVSSNPITSQYRLTNSEFQQLGQDLAAGNLSSAQSDFAILQQAFGQTSSTSSSSASASSTSNPVAQAFQQLSSDLKSGNLTGAQKDYLTIQQDLQNQWGSHHLHNHHHTVGSGNGNELNELNLMQGSTTSTPQTGSSSPQQVYAALAQELQQLALANSGSTNVMNPVSLLA